YRDCRSEQKKLGIYRWYLAAIVFSGFLWDIHITIFLAPFPLLPYISFFGRRNTGLLSSPIRCVLAGVCSVFRLPMADYTLVSFSIQIIREKNLMNTRKR
ncbi:hypothetical protein PENTCL1PPCAC_28581, partial [Pristionchus entomophagus]